MRRITYGDQVLANLTGYKYNTDYPLLDPRETAFCENDKWYVSQINGHISELNQPQVIEAEIIFEIATKAKKALKDAGLII